MRRNTLMLGAAGLLLAGGAMPRTAGAQVSQFDGPEDLDLTGNFVTAFHAAPSNVDGSHTVGDATFVPRDLSGATITESGPGSDPAGNPDQTAFGGPNYDGGTSANNELEAINDYVVYAGVDLANPNNAGVLNIGIPVTGGQQYKLQLIYNEACCDRVFDVEVEGVLVADNFDPGDVQTGGPDPDGGPQTAGALITYTFTAGDNVLNIVESGSLGFADRNPILDALTLELIPEPGSLALFAVAGLGLLRRRR